MKWLENLDNIVKEKKPGKCPHCGSEDTDYSCTIVIPEKRLGHMTIWCNDCMRGYHISRMEVPEGFKTGGKIPEGLKY
ncbi:hypothetical protein FND36_02905 [Lachnospiraceae bacterium KGMB03038]|nr:hypothetical protein FND36_02905 [Lachnospiraceae bacterium KGMB03038]